MMSLLSSHACYPHAVVCMENTSARGSCFPANLELSTSWHPTTTLPLACPPAHLLATSPPPTPQYLSASADRAVRNTYKLLAVLVHSGGVHGGHYFAYVRCGLGQCGWQAAWLNSCRSPKAVRLTLLEGLPDFLLAVPM